MKPAAQPQSEKELSREGDVASPPDPGTDADKRAEEGRGAVGESEDWQNDSVVSSGWDSAALEAEALEASLGKRREPAPGVRSPVWSE